MESFQASDLRRRRAHRWLVTFTALVLLASVMPVSSLEPTPETEEMATIHPDVAAELEAEGEAEVMIHIDDRPDLGDAFSMEWSQRGRFVFETLQDHARDSQAEVIAELEDRGASYESFWIANVVLVKADRATVDSIAAIDQVDSISLVPRFRLPEVDFVESDATPQATEWGLEAINAPETWDQYGTKGKGIVVGVLDSGVQFDHPALVAKYRGNDDAGDFAHDYNWFDPTGICGSASADPCDNAGHGTHVTGTVLGSDDAGNQIGVAPDAQWIAAKGCEASFCTAPSLLAAGQWMLAPTRTDGTEPDPDMRPHIVNNSWGGTPGNPWYMEMVDNWVAAGMFPQFASGNPGDACGAAGSPGDYSQSYSTGGFDSNGNVYQRSGRGPSAIDGGTKPNISAPAVEVRSSLPGDTYGLGTGTSMASPHVAGTIALMWAAAPTLVGEIDETRAILDQTAIDTADSSCGGTAENNNVWGEGKLDALESVAHAPRGATGTLTGTASGEGGERLADAVVTVEGPSQRIITTNEDGIYSLHLTVGDYAITVDAYGYESATTTVTIAEEETTTQDFELTPVDLVTTSGTVTDGSGQGWPLYARIDIDGYPGPPVFTDPVTGDFSVDLAPSRQVQFNVEAVTDGYQTQQVEFVVSPDAPIHDFALEVDAATCSAPGYVQEQDQCHGTGGGMVVGEITDLFTGEPLTRAQVTVTGAADETTTVISTPDDPALSDGFYMLYSTATGAVDITVGQAFYVTTTEPVEVMANAAARADVAVGSGRLTTNADPLTGTVDMGGTTEFEVTITNEGTAPANFEIGSRQPLVEVASESQEPKTGDTYEAQPGADDAQWDTKGASKADANAEPGFWHEGTPLPEPMVRYAHAQCEGDGTGFYVIAGLDGDVMASDRMYYYDGREDTWTKLARIPNVQQENLTAVCVEGEQIHLLGGGAYFGTALHHYVYDIATDNWSTALPAPRPDWGGEAAYWDGRIYLIGGGRVPAFGPPSGEVNVYDVATDAWLENAEPLPNPVAVPGIVQIGRYVYVVGGWGPPGPAIHQATTQRLDLVTGEWSLGPELAFPRGEIAVTATESTLYAIGGSQPGKAPNSGSTVVERLDLGSWPSGSWETMEDLPMPRGVGRGGFCTELRPGQEIWSVAGGDMSITDTVLFGRVDDRSCPHAPDVPWLTASPEEGTIDPGDSATVTITMSAVDLEVVDQPGEYRAEVIVRADTPEFVDALPVDVTVNPPEDWGRLTGTVERLGRCDVPGQPLDGASVNVGDDTIAVGDDGSYVRWLPPGEHTISAHALGTVEQSTTVTIASGTETSHDFDLRLDEPCIDLGAGAIDLEVVQGSTRTFDLGIANRGPAGLDFETMEVPFPMDQGPEILDESGDTPTETGAGDVAAGWNGLSEPGDHPGSTQAEGDFWQEGSDLPGGLVRYGHAQCRGDDGGLYVISGVPGTFGVSRNLWRFEAETGEWLALAAVPVGGEGTTAVCASGTIHVFGGGRSGGTDRHFIYDIETDSWTTGAPVPRRVWGAAAGYWDGRIYLVGGVGVSWDPQMGVSSEVNVYDVATDTWLGNTAPMPTMAGALGYAQIDHYLFVVGGWGISSPAENMGTTHRLDLRDGSWSSGPELAHPRGDLALAVTDTALYAIGGNPANSDDDLHLGTTIVERLDYTEWPSGTWEEIEPLPISKVALGAGACTETDSGAVVWSIAGASDSGIGGATHFGLVEGESCASGRLDVPWLEISPGEGAIGGDSESEPIRVSVDATNLELGDYTATLVVIANDEGQPHSKVPIRVEVVTDDPDDPDDPDDHDDQEDPGDDPGDNPGDDPGDDPGSGDDPDTGDDPDNDDDDVEYVDPDPNFHFGDVGEDHLFDYEIRWLAANGITMGCNPPENNMFCPDETTTRGQMAAFLVRALRLPPGDATFSDAEGHLFDNDIAAIAEAGITFGCNPPDNTMFCPDDDVSRGQMAAFLVRALDLPPGGRTFDDTDGHVFERDVSALAAANVTYGCNPPDNTRFCPDDPVTRGQMAAFLYRALGR